MRPILSALVGTLLCAAPSAAQPLDAAIDHYLQGRYAQSVQILDSLLRAEPGNVDARVWIAENHMRTGNPDGALAFADAALELEPCNAAAHNLVASFHNLTQWEAESRERTWMHARQAVECDPDDGNAWLTYWISGMMRQDGAAQALAQRRLAELRFIPAPVMEMGRWILRSAPPGAVLFTNGDWDFFPIVVAQSQEGLRPDVTVATIGMLEVPWFARRLAERVGWPVPPELSAQGGDEWSPAEAYIGQMASIAGRLWARASLEGGRPLSIPITAPPGMVGDGVRVRWDGPVYTLLPRDQAPEDDELRIDPQAFAASMRHLDLARLQGPLVHPTDRSPIRRTSPHPASTILIPVFYYAAQGKEAGRMDDVAQAIKWADALVATGNLTEQDLTSVDAIRAMAEGDAP